MFNLSSYLIKRLQLSLFKTNESYDLYRIITRIIMLYVIMINIIKINIKHDNPYKDCLFVLQLTKFCGKIILRRN